ncbi:MAG: class I SAM-dependent methyltransferase [Chloroflexi bacterium]|nr:class I SAM-dependent methyltransferase [Chloroflexota bacterium]
MTAVPSAWRSVPLSTSEVPSVVSGMQAYYDDRAGEYDDWYLHVGMYDDPPHNERWQVEVGIMTGWVQAFAHGRLLEIASGTGWWTRRLARRAQVTTLDYSPAMIGVLRARLAAEGARADVSRGDAYRLPFRSGGFNACFFGFWLSHVPSPLLDGFFAEVARVIQPGGAVLIVDSKPFRGEAPGVELKQERILNDGSRHAIVKVYHTPETLAGLLSRYGDGVDTWSSGSYFTAGVYRPVLHE